MVFVLAGQAPDPSDRAKNRFPFHSIAPKHSETLAFRRLLVSLVMQLSPARRL